MKPAPPHTEDGFRSIAENAPESLLVAQGFDAPCLYANRRACELSGYTLSELMGIEPSQLVPIDERDRIRQQLEMLLRGEDVPEACGTTLRRKDGHVLPIEITEARILWRGNPAVLILIRDVSHDKRREAELEAQADRFKAEWQDAVRQLERKREEVIARDLNLERITRELVMTNTALSVLARNLDRRRDELEKNIALAVSAKIMPVLNELRSDQLPVKSLSKLEMLSTLLADLAPEGSKTHEVIAALSATELRVALMIKKGFSSARIAELLNMSSHTIKTHRRSIRKKLGLQNSKLNLSSYLKFKFSKEYHPAIGDESIDIV